MASKMRGIRLQQGQSVRLETPGGGGYGAPEGRNPKLVAQDVAMGFVSAENATLLYGPAWQEEQP
jgi:N-methylhydantoinase B